MNCEKMEANLISYMDGRASERERHAVDLHLLACVPCRTRVEEFRRISGLLEQAPSHEPSTAFDARLRLRLSAEPAPGLFGWVAPLLRPVLAFGFLALACVWVSTRPPELVAVGEVGMKSEDGFRMIRDLAVLEDYDVLADFEALNELPPAPKSEEKM